MCTIPRFWDPYLSSLNMDTGLETREMTFNIVNYFFNKWLLKYIKHQTSHGLKRIRESIYYFLSVRFMTFAGIHSKKLELSEKFFKVSENNYCAIVKNLKFLCSIVATKFTFERYPISILRLYWRNAKTIALPVFELPRYQQFKNIAVADAAYHV